MADTTVERVRIEITAESKEAEAKVNALKKALDSVRGKSTTEIEASGVQRATAAYSDMKRKVSGVGKAMQAAKKMALSFTKSLLGVNAVKNSFKDLKNNISKLGASLGRIALYRAMRSAIKNFTQGIREGIQNLYQYSSVVGTQFKRSLDQMATSALYVKNSLATIAEPIINKIAPVLDALSDKFANLAAQVAEFLAKLTGSETYTRALKFPVAYADAANGAAKAMQKWLGPFDEINRLSAPSGSGSGAALDYSKMFETIEVNKDSPISKFVDMLKDGIAKGDLTEVGGMISGKIRDALDRIEWPTIQKKAENIASNIGTFLNGFFTEPGFAESVGASVGEAINTGLTFASTFFKKTDFYGIGLSIGTMIRTGFERLDSNKLADTITGFLSGVPKGIQGFVNSGALRAVARKLGETLGKILSNKQFWLDCFAAVGDISLALGDAIIGLIEGAWEGITGNKLNLPSLSNTSTSNGGSVDPTIIGGGIVTWVALKKILGLGAAAGTAAGAGAGSALAGAGTALGAAGLAAVGGYGIYKGTSAGIGAYNALQEQIAAEERLIKQHEMLQEMLNPELTKQRLVKFEKTVNRTVSNLNAGIMTKARNTGENLASETAGTFKTLNGMNSDFLNGVIDNVSFAEKNILSEVSNGGVQTSTAVKNSMGSMTSSVRTGTGVFKDIIFDSTGKIVGTVKEGFFSTEKSISGSLNNSKTVISTVWGNIKTSVSSYVDQVTGNTKKGFENTTSTITNESSKWASPVKRGMDAVRVALDDGTTQSATKTKTNVEQITATFNDGSAKWGLTAKLGMDNVKKFLSDSSGEAATTVSRNFASMPVNIENSTSTLGKKIENTTKSVFRNVKAFGADSVGFVSDAYRAGDSVIARHLNNIDDNSTKKFNNIIRNAGKTKTALETMNGSQPVYSAPGVKATTTTMLATAFANGGFVDNGEAFIARESGPELVGRIGNRTAVANNAQIVAGISEGVEEANMGVVNAIYAVANQIVGAIKSNGGSGVDWDSITRQISRTQARQAVSANI